MYSEYENSIELATYESCWDIRGSSLQEGLRLGGGCVGEGAVLGKGLCWMWGVVVERGLCWRGCLLLLLLLLMLLLLLLLLFTIKLCIIIIRPTHPAKPRFEI